VTGHEHPAPGTLLQLDAALERMLAGVEGLSAEEVSIDDAPGRVLAEDVRARDTLPPWDDSAMDGYAVRSADVAVVPSDLRIIGESIAGGPYAGKVGAGEAARIFTGASVPHGADAVVIQEDTERDGDAVLVKEAAKAGAFVRPAGLDFRTGDVGIAAGRVLGARDIGLAAAMNHPWLRVRRRPRVAWFA